MQPRDSMRKLIVDGKVQNCRLVCQTVINPNKKFLFYYLLSCFLAFWLSCEWLFSVLLSIYLWQCHSRTWRHQKDFKFYVVQIGDRVSDKASKGKTACTKFTRINTNGKYSLVLCKPVTGRTHQVLILRWLKILDFVHEPDKWKANSLINECSSSSCLKKFPNSV